MAVKDILIEIKSTIQGWLGYNEVTQMDNPWNLWNTRMSDTQISLEELIDWINNNCVTFEDVDTKIYPVGTYIFIESLTYNPNGKLPGVWTKLPKGSVIISGTTSPEEDEYYIGKTIGENSKPIPRACLPNENLQSTGTAEYKNLEGTIDLAVAGTSEDSTIVLAGGICEAIHSTSSHTQFGSSDVPSQDAFIIHASHDHSVTVNGLLGSGARFDARQQSRTAIVWKRVS